MQGTIEAHREWLRGMQRYCEQLEAWIDTVGEDCDTAALGVLPQAQREAQEWDGLRWGLHARYNFDIPLDECREQITVLHNQACACYQKLRAHKELGRFRPGQPSMFYERTLMMAMAVGVQHALKEGGCCTDGAQRRRRAPGNLW